MGSELGLRDPKVFKPLWVMDFPLEQDEDTERYPRCTTKFTSPSLINSILSILILERSRLMPTIW